MIFSIFFSKPVFLWLLLLLPLLIILHQHFLQKTYEKAISFANFRALKRVSGRKFISKNYFLLFLRIIVLLLFIGSLSQLTVLYPATKTSADFVFALDTSMSMSTTDILPSRLDFAKDSISVFIDQVNSSTKLALTSFSGVSYIESDLSNNFIPLRLKLSSLSTSTSGTDISGAIITSTNVLLNSEHQKHIILITDGVDTSSLFDPTRLVNSLNYAKQQGVIVDVVGLGSENVSSSYLPEDLGLIEAIDKEQLDFIAQSTGGTVVYPSSDKELKDYFAHLLEPSTKSNVQKSLSSFFFFLGFLILFIEWLLANTRFRKVI